MKNTSGITKLPNGNWSFRFVTFDSNGVRHDVRKQRDEFGNPLLTKTAALRAKELELKKLTTAPKATSSIITFSDIMNDYLKNGTLGKAYGTVLKQTSIWNNHIAADFGNKLIENVYSYEINEYLCDLYYNMNYSYMYTEGFLKIFYLLISRAHSKDLISTDKFNKLCVNKDTRIKMPKLKVDDDTDIVAFSSSQMKLLDGYFKGTNAETAYMLGKYCGLRINECYGLTWDNIDLDKGTITVTKQMQYQEGVIKLVPLKTRNARRTIYMSQILIDYFKNLLTERDSAINNLSAARAQNAKIIPYGDSSINSLELVNTLDNGKIQTVNSMKFHSQTIKGKLNINFKYHYLRHTYGTTLANLNTPQHLLCAQMGHSSINVTSKYYIAVSEDGINILRNNMNKF